MHNREFEYKPRLQCPLCGDEHCSIEMTGLFDDRFGHPDDYTVGRCSACKFSFLRERLDHDALLDLYSKYYPYSEIKNEVTTWRNSRILRARIYRKLSGNVELAYHVNPGEKVLDVGCGGGSSLRIVRALGGVPKGIEIDERCISNLKSQGFDYFRGTLEEFAITTTEQFDLVIMNQFLEHTYDPIETARAAKSVLLPRGRIFLCCPNYESVWRTYLGVRWIHWHVPYHVNYFSRRSLAVVASGAGLRLATVVTRTPADWAAMNLSAGFHKSVRGVANERLRFHRSPIRTVWLLPHSVLFDFLGRGDALVASFVMPG
jgi:2-polyprenyl-3-methyl-5-hydroxy-6-metoxy-1,4-benzoquinol methylase